MEIKQLDVNKSYGFHSSSIGHVDVPPLVRAIVGKIEDGDTLPDNCDIKVGELVYLVVDSDWTTGLPKSVNGDYGIQKIHGVWTPPTQARNPVVSWVSCAAEGQCRLENSSISWDEADGLKLIQKVKEVVSEYGL
jgi:hypothetical protein